MTSILRGHHQDNVNVLQQRQEATDRAVQSLVQWSHMWSSRTGHEQFFYTTWSAWKQKLFSVGLGFLGVEVCVSSWFGFVWGFFLMENIPDNPLPWKKVFVLISVAFSAATWSVSARSLMNAALLEDTCPAPLTSLFLLLALMQDLLLTLLDYQYLSAKSYSFNDQVLHL